MSGLDELLSSGADANVVDKDGETPLYIACDKQVTVIVRKLLEHGADAD